MDNNRVYVNLHLSPLQNELSGSGETRAICTFITKWSRQMVVDFNSEYQRN